MGYVLVIVLPPFAIAACGKWVQFSVNLPSSLVLFFGLSVAFILSVLCVMHAVVLYRTKDRQRQIERLVWAIEGRPQ